MHASTAKQLDKVRWRPAALAAAAGVLRADEGHWRRLGGRLAEGEGRRGHANTQMNGCEEGLSSE